MQAKSSNSLKQRRVRTRIISFTLALGLPFLLYLGYCFGLWGRSSLFLQYLFQCNCPSFSEEWRYPKEVDVIVSACGNAGIRLSSSGRLLYVEERKLGFSSSYLLDLRTNEKIPFVRPDLPEGDFSFLTDDLIHISGHILDRTTNTLYPIEKYVSSHPDAYVNGNTDLIKLAEALREAKEIYFIDGNIVVALASDFRAHPEYNFITGKFDIPGFDTNRVKLFLQENHIPYRFIPSAHPDEVVSRDGRFTARHDGIYLNETNQRIVKSHWGMVRGWIEDNSGAIYAPYYGGGGPCLISSNFGFLDDSACFFEVSQPVLLLKVP
jgi:hypothetical protein